MSRKKENKCNECGIDLCDKNWIYAAPKYSLKIRLCDQCRERKEHANWLGRQPNDAKAKKEYRLKLRAEVMNHYGNRCIKCGEDNFYFLTIDHINNDGNIDRNIKKLGGGHNFYRWVIKNNYPTNLILCFNCNCSASVMPDYKSTNIRHMKRKAALKNSIVEAYGGECNFCGHNIQDHMTIDHISGVEKSDGRSSARLYRYLRDSDYPTDNYQLLCYNCNCAKSHFGFLPGIYLIDKVSLNDEKGLSDGKTKRSVLA